MPDIPSNTASDTITEDRTEAASSPVSDSAVSVTDRAVASRTAVLADVTYITRVDPYGRCVITCSRDYSFNTQSVTDLHDTYEVTGVGRRYHRRGESTVING